MRSRKVHITRRFTKDTNKLRKENPSYLKKVKELLQDIKNNPQTGIGKPEQLAGNMKPAWSRRITKKHRLIYEFTDKNIILISCYGHYDDK